MKLIGIGLEVPAIPMKSWVARANPTPVRRRRCNAGISRPITVALYQPDSQVLKLEGRGVKTRRRR